MPWCPQCGAEYVEGIAECRKCEVVLVEERPEAPAGPEVVPRPRDALSRTLSQFPRGLRYGLEALRLLRRRPGLLWLPLLVVCFNAAEVTLGNYLTFTYTASGRRVKAESETWNQYDYLQRQLLSSRSVARNAAVKALEQSREPIAGPGFAGLGRLVFASFEPLSSDHAMPWHWWLLGFLMPFVLVIPPVALFLSGFYGLVKDAVSGFPARREVLAASLRSNFWRFLVYLAVLEVVSIGLGHILMYLPVRTSSKLAMSLYVALQTWTHPLVLALFGLGLVAITLDRVSPLRAAGRSAKTVLRGIPVFLALFAPLSLLLVPLQVYNGVMVLRIYSQGFYSASAQAGTAALALASGTVLALLGVWLCLAQFLWYREANPVAVAIPEEAQA